MHGPVERVTEVFARAAEGATTVYLVGGATAVLLGWRASPVAIDFVARPEDDAVCGRCRAEGQPSS
jgi:hypothetical protein